MGMQSSALGPCFLGLARELRDKFYALLLVCGEDIDLNQPWSYSYLSVGAIRTHRQICEEATEILYGQNRFALCRNRRESSPFEDTSLASFLEGIGTISCLRVRHIRIDFSDSGIQMKESGDLLGVSLEADPMLDTLQKHCSNLRKLTTSRASAESQADYLNNHQRPEFLVEVFDLIEARLRAISARRDEQQAAQYGEIVTAVEVNAATVEEDPAAEMRLEMLSCGWALHRVEVVREEDELEWEGD